MGARRRNWLPEASLLCAIAVTATMVFAVTPLDVDVERLFYRADGPDHWPLGKVWPWSGTCELAA
jgi:hypothetical protein